MERNDERACVHARALAPPFIAVLIASVDTAPRCICAWLTGRRRPWIRSESPEREELEP